MKAEIVRESVSSKRIYIWNSLGSLVYALSSFLMLIIVVRFCGSEEGGVFSIGYAIAQLMLTVGVFEATTFFATDAQNRFSYAQYLAFKLVTCMLMIVVSVVYITSFGYDEHKTLVAYALVAYRLFEAFSQFWFAAFQKQERLDLGGFSSTWRSVLSMAAFTAVLFVSSDLIVALIAATAVEAIWIACYDIPRLRLLVKIGRPDFSAKPLFSLFLACLPLFIGSFLATYLGNVCKYAIDAVGTYEMQTIYNILFMPSFVINLFVNFFIRPSLTHLADLWLKHEVGEFMKVVGKLLAIVAAITVGVCAACALIGIPILEAFYGVDLAGCLPALLILLVGGGFLSASNVFYNAMVIIRAQNGVLVGYGVAIVVATLISSPIVADWGITGAAVAYALSCTGLLAAFTAIFAFCARAQMRVWKR